MWDPSHRNSGSDEHLWDFVVVGAGSAGSVLAAELSADPACRVALVEAGPRRNGSAVAASRANALTLPIGEHSSVVRRYPTMLTNQPQRAAHLVRGSVVGGCGAINGAYFCRGLPRDFDAWGVPGWSWADVLSHYRAIESDADFEGPAHGTDGPIPVRRTTKFACSTESFAQAAAKAGYSWIADLNDPPENRSVQQGIGAVPLNVVAGKRIGPGQAYLEPATGRPNLRLLTGTRVRRIRFRRTRAVAVEAIGPGGAMMLTAERIVLCAGAIETAHLLMLSGIGDAATLRRFGIEVVSQAAVGTRCTDHPEWVLSTTWEGSDGRTPLEVVLTPGDHLEIRPYTAGFGALAGLAIPHERTALGVALMQTRSRVRMTLASPDPRTPLVIRHSYDESPHDINALRRGADLVRELCGEAIDPAPPVWSTSQHLSGSAPMGADTDDAAVLDAQCRVRGVQGLWVVDGSTMPDTVSRGPHATIAMIAHRAVEFLRSG